MRNDASEGSAYIGETPSSGAKCMFTYQDGTRITCKKRKNFGLCREIDISVLL